MSFKIALKLKAKNIGLVTRLKRALLDGDSKEASKKVDKLSESIKIIGKSKMALRRKANVKATN
jgi:hypothetical protein